MPKNKSGKSIAQPSDDELLDAAIAANKAVAAEQAAKITTPEVPATPATPKAALTQHQIIDKLNAVPTFCILNADSNIVAMQKADGSGEVCSWFTDAEEARRMLASAKEQNPEVAAGLHLGVTPLGLAFALAMGWADSLFVGEMRLQGKPSVVDSMAAALQQQAEAQGFEVSGWVLPTFCCDELQSETIMPVFLSRADLVAAWVASGRSRESVPENLAVIELRVLVAQMQTDSFAWSSVVFVGSPQSVDLVREAKVAAAVMARRKALAGGDSSSGAPPLAAGLPLPTATASDDAPPPLRSDDDPPPLQ